MADLGARTVAPHTAPEVRYATNEGVALAWTAIGDGPIDLLLVLGGISHVERLREEPGLARWFERLAGFSRLILMDRRGVGLSDPTSEHMTLEDECADLAAVLDAAGSERAVIFAYTWGGPIAIHFAAHHPERVQALVLYAATVDNNRMSDDFDRIMDPEDRRHELDGFLESWGTGGQVEQVAPSRADDERLRAFFARLVRSSSGPGGMRLLWSRTSLYDATDDLGRLRVPTLILHRRDDRAIDVEHSRFIAAHTPGARYVELEGEDNLPSVGDTEALVAEVEEFLTGTRRRPIARVLLTVMVTDIVDSTGRAARLGDADWRDLLAAHDAAIRAQLERFAGREVKTLGDGFLAVFDGPPSAALRCALAIAETVRDLGLELRIGLHTGECELIGDDVGGMAVHIADRVSRLAAPGEILCSGTACGTVVGSGLQFEDRGTHELKGVEHEWPVMRLLG